MVAVRLADDKIAAGKAAEILYRFAVGLCFRFLFKGEAVHGLAQHTQHILVHENAGDRPASLRGR